MNGQFDRSQLRARIGRAIASVHGPTHPNYEEMADAVIDALGLKEDSLYAMPGSHEHFRYVTSYETRLVPKNGRFGGRADLGDVATVDGRLARVITINEGREIGFELVEGVETCPTCGHRERPEINEGCLLWDQRVVLYEKRERR